MKRKNKKGSEIEPWEMQEPPKKPASASGDEMAQEMETITRKSFRGEVSESDAAEAQINGVGYQVVDIGSRGIGIALPHPESLSVDETYTVNLLLHGKSFSLEGKVKHISPSASDQYLCGIELLNVDDEVEQRLLTFLNRKRAQLFGFMGE